MYGAYGVTDRSLADSAVLLDRLHCTFHVADVVQCIEYADYVNTVLDTLANEIGWTPINMLNALPDAEIVSVTGESGASVITTGERKVALEGADASSRLVGARVIAFEVIKSDENGKYCLGLLCEDAEGKLFDENLFFSSINVDEIN